MEDPLESGRHRAVLFPSTCWSLVLRAGRRGDPKACTALGMLCQAYWYRIYAFIRYEGHAPQDAEDLTQEYFARLMEKGVIAAADPCKGRFRAFLRIDCQLFLISHHRGEQVRARVRRPVPNHCDEGENRYRFEPTDEMKPDRLFERTWAMTLLDRVLDLLGWEYAGKGQGETFQCLKVVLTQGKGSISGAELAARLGMNENAVYVTVHRLKKR